MTKWRTGTNHWLFLWLMALVCAGICIYQAKEYAGAAPSERTTTAQLVSVYHSVFRGFRFNYYSCSYNFTVDGSLYIGLRDCPQWIVDDAVNRKYLDSGAVPIGTRATAYYDPTDPSVNSLLEFSTESQIEYRTAIPWIGLGASIFIFFIFAGLLAANEKKGRGGIVVDAKGTIINPEQIGLGPESGISLSSENGNGPTPSALRELYLEVVNEIHPDRAADEDDRALRDRLMKDANAAFERGDAATLHRVQNEYKTAKRVYSS